jgi:hypothetical protein
VPNFGFQRRIKAFEHLQQIDDLSDVLGGVPRQPPVVAAHPKLAVEVTNRVSQRRAYPWSKLVSVRPDYPFQSVQIPVPRVFCDPFDLSGCTVTHHLSLIIRCSIWTRKPP